MIWRNSVQGRRRAKVKTQQFCAFRHCSSSSYVRHQLESPQWVLCREEYWIFLRWLYTAETFLFFPSSLLHFIHNLDDKSTFFLGDIKFFFYTLALLSCSVFFLPLSFVPLKYVCIKKNLSEGKTSKWFSCLSHHSILKQL